MSSGPIATAFVRVVPDTSGFQAQLQAAVTTAVNNVTVPAVKTSLATGAAGAAAAASGGVRGGAGVASARAATGVKALTVESNALRGALIGLSRVTPVTVFGLGAYGTAALAGGLAIRSALKSTADFEHELNVFQATTGASGDEMEAVAEKAKQLGSDLSLPNTSAGDAAVAMTELAKAGLSVKDTLAGSTGVLQLAAAAQLDVGSAAEFVATELNAFGLAGNQATHIADLLAGASIAAQGDIRDFGTAFQQVSAVSRQVGLDVETTTGALTELAKAGLRGADGGTSLRTTLLRLAPTTKQAAEYQKALGIQIDKTKSIGAQLPDLIDQYRSSLSALSEVQRQQALAQIFGQDAIRAASILIRGGSEALRENTDQANKSGSAARLAAANAKGLSGALNGLKNNADNLGLTLGGFVKGPLTDLIFLLSEGVGVVNTFAEALGGLHIPRGFKLGLKALFASTPVGALVTTAGFAADLLRGDDPSEATGAGFVRPNRQTPRGPGEGLPQGSQFLTPKERDRIRAAFKALQEDRKRRKLVDPDIEAPVGLQINQLNAELGNSLRAELTADQAIENYFTERKKLAIVGTKRYKSILAAEVSAHAAVEGVQAQIDANSNAAAAAAAAKRKQHLADVAQDQREAAQAAVDLFNLQKSQFELAIDDATKLHEKNIPLATRRYNAEITFLNARIKRIQSIKKLTTAEKQEVINLKGEVIALKAARNSLKAAQDDADGGETKTDVFAEAISQFNEFASNVSGLNGGLTPGQVRGGIAAGILAQQLTEATTTNELLKAMLIAMTGRGPTGGQTLNGDKEVGLQTQIAAAKYGHHLVGT